MTSTAVIDVERLNLKYGDFHTVKDLSFQVRRFTVIALILLAPTLAWVAVAVTLATRNFRWEPRR